MVANTLALIWLRLSDLANVGSDLADSGFIDTIDEDLLGTGLFVGFHHEIDPLWRFNSDWVRITHIEEQILSLKSYTVTDTEYIKRLGVTLRHALDHVEDEGSSQAMLAASLAKVVRALQRDLSVFLLESKKS